MLSLITLSSTTGIFFFLSNFLSHNRRNARSSLQFVSFGYANVSSPSLSDDDPTPTLERRRSPREVLSTLVSLLLLLLRRLCRKFLIKRYNIANKPRRNYQNAITERGLLYNSTYLYNIIFHEWHSLIFQPFTRLLTLHSRQTKRDYQ